MKRLLSPNGGFPQFWIPLANFYPVAAKAANRETHVFAWGMSFSQVTTRTTFIAAATKMGFFAHSLKKPISEIKVSVLQRW